MKFAHITRLTKRLKHSKKFELSVMRTGANKRDTGVTSPLDLSSPGGFAPRKRQRAETRRSGSVSPKPKPTPRPTTPPPVRCPSLCGHMPCGDGQAVNRWTIEDVVNYVSSIDICAEYAQVSGFEFLPSRWFRFFHFYVTITLGVNFANGNCNIVANKR